MVANCQLLLKLFPEKQFVIQFLTITIFKIIIHIINPLGQFYISTTRQI